MFGSELVNWEIRKPDGDKEVYEVGFEHDGVWYLDKVLDTPFTAGNRLLGLSLGGWMCSDSRAAHKLWELVDKAL